MLLKQKKKILQNMEVGVCTKRLFKKIRYIIYNLKWDILESIKSKKKSNQIYSRWNYKTWMVIGDSLTAKNITSNVKYHDLISSKINCKIINKGIYGSGYYNRYNLERINEKADLVTIWLGSNDFGNVRGHNKPLGTFGVSTDESISGCINIMYSKLIKRYPKSIIAIITPIPRLINWGIVSENNNCGYTLKQLNDLIINYSLPVLDLYNNSNLSLWNNESHRYYFTRPGEKRPDGLHLNDEGHELIHYKIMSFINSL